MAYASAPGEVRETLAKDSFINALTDSNMRIRIKQSRPQNLNEAIRLAVELEAYNRAERQNQISKGHLRVSNTEQTTPVTTAEASETSMEVWMKSMEANMNALTNAIKQLRTRESARKSYDRKSGDKQGRCYGCNKESHIKRNCPNVKKRPCVNEHNNAKKGSSRSVRSNVQPVCRLNGSIGAGSSLEEAGLYIKVKVPGMHAKFLVDTGATLTLLSQTLYETMPQETRPRLQNSKQNILAANGGELFCLRQDRPNVDHR